VKLEKTERIIQTTIAFIQSDFSHIDRNDEYEEEGHHIYNSIVHIYNDHNPYFWDDFVFDIYNVMPRTAGKRCFKILNELMLETRQMTSSVFNFIDAQDENLQELQLRFAGMIHNYITAMYTIQLLKEEFQENIIKKANTTTSKCYYKKNKVLIKKSIKEL
jgi:50S ribosomal subunit-associated GTPase HflX